MYQVLFSKRLYWCSKKEVEKQHYRKTPIKGLAAYIATLQQATPLTSACETKINRNQAVSQTRVFLA